MIVRLHPHAEERLEERGATREEVVETVERGERFPARFRRTGFRRNFVFGKEWRGRLYSTKQIEAYAARTRQGWLVITIVTRFF
jgi:hypothetical protein